MKRPRCFKTDHICTGCWLSRRLGDWSRAADLSRCSSVGWGAGWGYRSCWTLSWNSASRCRSHTLFAECPPPTNSVYQSCFSCLVTTISKNKLTRYFEVFIFLSFFFLYQILFFVKCIVEINSASIHVNEYTIFFFNEKYRLLHGNN